MVEHFFAWIRKVQQCPYRTNEGVRRWSSLVQSPATRGQAGRAEVLLGTQTQHGNGLVSLSTGKGMQEAIGSQTAVRCLSEAFVGALNADAPGGIVTQEPGAGYNLHLQQPCRVISAGRAV